MIFHVAVYKIQIYVEFIRMKQNKTNEMEENSFGNYLCHVKVENI